MRVGFLFNHYAVHQVPHAAPYAFELSRRHPEVSVVIATSSDAELELVRRIADLYSGHHCEIILLSPPRIYDLIDPIISKWGFLRKEMILRHNLDFFRGLDALVVPEQNSKRLKTHLGLDELKLIHTRHGAGDREGGFDERSHIFDLTLLPGQKYVDRLKELGFLESGSYVTAGWPKFEVVRGLQKEKARFFDDTEGRDNPVIVYNPHFDQDVASWSGMGLDVLEFFLQNPQYNLIFAPHTVLFTRSLRNRVSLPDKYMDVPNIHIDLGSTLSADMTYILAADIYLGDVSSQVYEFLLEPRPCIFLNAHGVDWKDDPNYLHWTLGQVVDDVASQLGPAIDAAEQLQEVYGPVQQETFEYTFHSEPGSTAAERGADAIAKFLFPDGAAPLTTPN